MAGFGTVLGRAGPRRLPRPDPEHPPGPAAGLPRLARRARRPGRRCGRDRHHRPRRHPGDGRRADPGPGGGAGPARTTPRRRLHERIKAVERTLYPATIRAFVDGLATPAGGWARIITRRCTDEGTAVRLRQDRARAIGPGPGRPGLGAGLERRHLGRAGRRPASPTSRWPTSPVPPRCWAAGSRPCTRRSTAASWPTGPSPTTWPTSSAQGIGLIDLVVCNLYPFSSDPSIELIDVGGPTMVRAAAKNHAHVGVVVRPGRLRHGARRAAPSTARCPTPTRRRLARDAFAHTAGYDAAIVDWFDEREPDAGRRRQPSRCRGRHPARPPST